MPNENDVIKRIGNNVCDRYLGFLPTSNSTKPLYIANSLFRECTGETCDISDIHSWIVSERRQGYKIKSSSDLIEKYQEILKYGNNENADQVKTTRFILEEIFNQDKTVYPGYDDSVLNISSHWLIRKSVRAEAKIGRFIFNILSQKIDSNCSTAIDIIRKALENDKDDITKLVKPIIAFPSANEKRTILPIDYCTIPLDSCKKTIRLGFDNLANNMTFTGQSKNSLLTLERIVNYSAFATLFYLININSATYGASGIPLLIDSGYGLKAIERASEECYIAAKKSVEDYFINCIEEILKDEIADGSSKYDCLDYIAEMPLSKKNEDVGVRKSIGRYFNNFCEEGILPILSLARALQIAVYTFEYKNRPPSDFCRVLGVKCGFVGPRGNAAKTKRLLINRFLLETITLSALTTSELEDGIEIKALGDRLRDQYWILIGTDAETDYTYLEKMNIAQNTPGDLRGDMYINARLLSDMFISMNLAKKYADGVTIIGSGL